MHKGVQRQSFVLLSASISVIVSVIVCGFSGW